MPSLVPKRSVVQKIEGKQRFNEVFNRHCERDLEQNNPIFIQDTPAYDDVLTNSSWLQKDQQFSTYSRNSCI